MKKVTSLLISFCVIVSGFAQHAGAEIDSLISAYATINKFNGVALVASQGKILLSKGYGYANLGEKTPNTQNSIFLIGSITKQFTSAVILKLQEENKLTINDPISKYFPDYPKGDSITIQQLLTHTSGIYSYTNNHEFMEKEISKPQNKEKMLALFRDQPLDFAPGTKWSYSNSGYSLLGYIIEAVTKRSYEEAVYKYIFNPAKMTHSGFDFTHLKSPDKTTGYLVANLADTVIAPIADSSISFAAGAIYSTVGDMYRWHRSLQDHLILSKAQQELAYTPVKNNYGYGWFIDSIEGKRRVWHTGGTPGYITIESRVPEDDIFILLLSNASNKSLKDILKSIYSILYKKEYKFPVERKIIELPDSTLQEYVGEYELTAGFTIEISIKGKGIAVQPKGDTKKVFLPEKKDVFFENQDEIGITFKRNDKNEVTSLELLQSGQKLLCKKIK